MIGHIIRSRTELDSKPLKTSYKLSKTLKS